MSLSLMWNMIRCYLKVDPFPCMSTHTHIHRIPTTFVVAQTRAFKSALCWFESMTNNAIDRDLVMRMIFFSFLFWIAKQKRNGNRDGCVVIRAHVELNLSKGIMAGKSENKQMNSELEIMRTMGSAQSLGKFFSHVRNWWALPLWPC